MYKLSRFEINNINKIPIKKENKIEKSVRNIKEGYLSNHVKLLVKKLMKAELK